MRLAFMGSPGFAVPALAALIAAGHKIACVYSQPPRPSGRGQHLRQTPVHYFAAAQGIEVRTPKSLKGATAQAEFAALDLDLAVVVAYGLILPQAILSAPRLGCVNLHASLLPRWRGAAPIQRALMAGDTQTGVQAMMMEAGLDTGPILLSQTVPIAPNDTAGTLHDKLAAVGALLLSQAVAALGQGSARPIPQAETGVCYAHKLDSAEFRVDWSKPAAEVDRQIRGLAPAPGAWCLLPTDKGPVRLKLLMSRPADGSGAPGQVIGRPLVIACGEGAVGIELAQREGRGVVAADALVNALGIAIGAVFD